MAKKSGVTKHDLEAAEFLRLGGRKVPAGLAAKAREAMTKSMLRKKPEAGTNLLMQGAILYGELKGASPIAVDDPANRTTLDEILRLHKQIAGKKLAFPKVTPARGRLSTAISGAAVPPFDSAGSTPFPFANFLPIIGNPTLTGTANENGQISASAVTSYTEGSAGGEFAQVGIYFSPPMNGRLTISASPTYSFEWATNSLNTSSVWALGFLQLYISGVDGQGVTQEQNEDSQIIFNEAQYGQVNFNFQFGLQQSLSTSLDVTPSLLYLCYVAVLAEVWGAGWPGSLAVAMMSATVPSISYEFLG
jgi:hypothetical protein